MNTHVIIVALISATFAAGSVEAAKPQDVLLSARNMNASHRSLSDIRRDVHTALRSEALSRRLGPNAPEVIDLVELYRELAAHPKRDSSGLVAQLGLQLRSRLTRVRDHIERKSSQPDRQANKRQAPPNLIAAEHQVLAQLGAVAGGAVPGQGAQPPANQPGATRTIDYGPELVDVIQQTISPATWDINGGNSSIVYFAPLRVIVVSAPGTVHSGVRDVLGQLRAAP
jgi:hypothetical protein